MMSNELQRILDTLKQQGRMDFKPEATSDEISKFERENGIEFPAKFKEWLLFSDGGELFLPAGVQFYGVSHKPLIDVSYDDRPTENYVVIGGLSTGDPVLFAKGEERISIFNHEAGIIEDDESYDDFFAFLKDLYELLGIGG